MEGSWFKYQCRKNMKGDLLIGEGANIPSEHCRGTLEQGLKPTHAHIGPCDELVIHPGVDPAFLSLSIVYPPHDPKKDKVFKKTRQNELDIMKTMPQQMCAALKPNVGQIKNCSVILFLFLAECIIHFTERIGIG